MGCCWSAKPVRHIEPYIAPHAGETKQNTTEDIKINSEFSELKKCPVKATSEDGRKTKNNIRNRYADIIPYDYNRVRLQNGDYINASHIEPNFIATQDPLLTEDSVFWLMVWANNVKTIVRLSTDVEGFSSEDGQQTRCAVYIPTNKWVTDHHLDLTFNGTSQQNTFTETSVIIRKDGRQLEVKHYHIQGWSSSSFPEASSTLETIAILQRKIKAADKSSKSKILVHCGAGTGRTGTFIALWQLTDAWNKGQKKDILELCKKLRGQRIGMISQPHQYAYLYECWQAHGKTGHVNHAMV